MQSTGLKAAFRSFRAKAPEEDPAELAAREAGERALRLVHEVENHGNGWFWETDRAGRLTYISAKVAAEFARLGIDLDGALLTDILQIDGAMTGTERTLAFHFSSRTAFSDYSVCPVRTNEEDRCWTISGSPFADAFGRFEGFVGSGSDLAAKRRSDAEITRLALFDSLTGLANRQRMNLSLEQTLAQQHAHYGPTALFLLDLDRFKAVNDALGHQTGDALLKQVAQRLLRVIGESGLVGRLGGDEFQVVLPRIADRAKLSELARAVIASLSQPYFIAGSSISIGCSIGIAIAPKDGDNAEVMVRNADLALYAAKADGRGVHRFYREELLAGVRSRKEMEDDLRQALALDQFRLAYQPVVSTGSEAIVGFEALVRWQHPTRGMVSPAEFIPVAEECGLIESIGEWVLRTACIEAAGWPGEVRVAVNVSPIQFVNPALPAVIANALARAGLSAGRLELEITEGVFLNESAGADEMFRALKGLGVRLALDDFGTGYSSLGYLRKAPFDKIKIDQSFVRGAAQPGNRNAAIIKAIVTLADTLGMETTAEGVEVQDEITLIRELGCSHIQGYVYGRPMPCGEVVALLDNSGARAIATGFKVSRPQRTRMLRWAAIEMDGQRIDVRVRDLSSAGAMIDGVPFDDSVVGRPLFVELIEGQMISGTVRWTTDGRAGIQFDHPFNMERLSGASTRPNRAKSG